MNFRKILRKSPLLSFLSLYVFLQIFVMSKDFETEKGKKLAQVYCGTCHKVPLPEELDKVTWEQYVLPRMKKMMGIDSILESDDFFDYKYLSEIKNRGTFMDFSSLPISSWDAIHDYYIYEAPVTLNPKDDEEIMEISSLFKPIFPSIYSSPPSTSLIRFDGSHILWSDIHTQSTYILNHNFDAIKSIKNPAEGLVDVDHFGKGKIFTFMGSFSPTDDTTGMIYFLDTMSDFELSPLIYGLRRPVKTLVNDINQDGKDDIIVAEFGKWLGQLTVFINQGSGSFKKMILSKKPGSVNAEVVDLNNDGLLDIIGLFAQGDEHISVFTQNRDGSFVENRVLEFSPAFGSTGFSMHDFNHDKHPDILYYNGDLADFPISAKPYQGIWIYLNDGKGQFVKNDFLQASGVYQAHVADFDMDGDIDIFCNSFFPNKGKPKVTGLSLFENINGKYQKKSLVSEDKGRWLVSDMADLEGDGDMDIIVGNLIMELPGHQDKIQTWVKDGLPFMILKNSTID
jgi:hypothetical protein